MINLHQRFNVATSTHSLTRQRWFKKKNKQQKQTIFKYTNLQVDAKVECKIFGFVKRFNYQSRDWLPSLCTYPWGSRVAMHALVAWASSHVGRGRRRHAITWAWAVSWVGWVHPSSSPSSILLTIIITFKEKKEREKKAQHSSCFIKDSKG